QPTTVKIGDFYLQQFLIIAAANLFADHHPAFVDKIHIQITADSTQDENDRNAKNRKQQPPQLHAFTISEHTGQHPSHHARNPCTTGNGKKDTKEDAPDVEAFPVLERNDVWPEFFHVLGIAEQLTREMGKESRSSIRCSALQ